MAKFYKIRIEMKKMTIDQVPERWRKETEELLEKEG